MSAHFIENNIIFGLVSRLGVVVVVVGVLEVIRIEAAGGDISSLLMLAWLSFVCISSCPEKDGSTQFPAKSPDNHLYRMAYKVKPSGPCH